MRRLGLIDEEGALTARGNKWRVDSSYSEACEEILSEVYPEELAALQNSDGGPDRTAVFTWLQHKGLGNSNANQMAKTYILIASRVPPEGPPTNNSHASNGQPKKSITTTPSAKDENPSKSIAPEQEKRIESDLPGPPKVNSGGPQIHLDIQIHIPATADAKQIDAIFASMAKHLYP